jgi:hypothetical protein
MVHIEAVCPVVLVFSIGILPERDLFAAVARVHAGDAGSLSIHLMLFERRRNQPCLMQLVKAIPDRVRNSQSLIGTGPGSLFLSWKIRNGKQPRYR